MNVCLSRLKPAFISEILSLITVLNNSFIVLFCFSSLWGLIYRSVGSLLTCFSILKVFSGIILKLVLIFILCSLLSLFSFLFSFLSLYFCIVLDLVFNFSFELCQMSLHTFLLPCYCFFEFLYLCFMWFFILSICFSNFQCSF